MAFQLVVLQGRSATQTIRLGQGVTTAGRQEGCQLRINSSQVSRKHCELFEKKGLLLVKDLGSSNGTLVNGKKIAEQQVLSPGDELTIGNVKFRVEKVDQEAPAVAVVGPGRPGDTAVAQPISVGGSDLIDVDAGDETVTKFPTVPDKAPAKAAAASPAESEPIELNDDDVADLLLDIELDDEDKR